MPAISVILPTYNRMATLPRAVDSVLAQDFSDFELIVVDDASTDATPDYVRGLKDPRVRYLPLAKNRGAAGARNAGIATATADWVAFQDSDDEWLPVKLAQQWAIARDAPADVGLVLGTYLAERAPRAIEIRPQATLAGRDPRADLLDGWPIITPTWLVRRALLTQLNGFDESYPCLEDWDLVFRLSDRCSIRAAAGPILVKHGSLDSVCADRARMRDALQRILATHAHRWDAHASRKARRLAHLGVLQYQLGDAAAARATLWQAVKHDPLTLATHGLLCASLFGGRALNFGRRLWPRYAGMQP